ncbi:MAG: helix-turn-helix domain-containing protein [Candidatus Krumholzibacteriota bacterium]
MSDKPLLKTPGEMISEARQAQDLTIAQLSERTKIPPPVLSALELDEYHKISGPLYIKSFLRTCATDLGLEPESVLGLYNKISGEQQGTASGADMVWEEEKVEVSRIGLPWVKIFLGAGVVAVLVGAVLFGMRGCDGDQEDELWQREETAGESAMPVEVKTLPAGVAQDSASAGDPRRESLIPPETEAELKERADVVVDPVPERSDFASEGRESPADTLSLGWQLNPDPPVEEMEVSAAPDMEPEVSNPLPASQAEGLPAAGVSVDVPREDPPEIDPVETPRSEPEPEPEPESEPEATTGSVEIRPAETPSAPDTVQEQAEVPSTGMDPPDSAWALVLSVVCDAPQRILVKRDGERESSEVLWPAESETVPEIPAAGFEAGRAYRQGNRLVVFWGAEDHFSLILARVRGVEVAVNGQVRDISKLRAGQELILDSHAAGFSVDR